MATLTIEISDELMEQLSPFRDQLPELLRRGLQPLAWNFFKSQSLKIIIFICWEDFLLHQCLP